MTYDEAEGLRARIERDHAPRLRRALDAVGRRAAALLAAEDYPVGVFLETGDVHAALRALWTDAVATFAARTAADVAPGKAVKLDDPWLAAALAFIEAEGAALVALVDETTLAVIREVVREGVVEGWSADRTARRLREVWPDVARVRAERIVRTEVVRASNHGSLEGARRTAAEYGLEMDKVWVSTPDGRTRDTHRTADGQRRGLEEPFDVGGYAAMYPADAALPASEAVACRCTVVFEPKEGPKTWRGERNARIKADYPALRDAEGQTSALATLAERENVSERTVRRVLWE